MSIKINLSTPHKENLAKILKEISDLIEVSTNKTVGLDMSLNFHVDKKEDC